MDSGVRTGCKTRTVNFKAKLTRRYLLEGSKLFRCDGFLMTEETVRRFTFRLAVNLQFFDGSEWGVGEGHECPSALQQNVTTAKGNS